MKKLPAFVKPQTENEISPSLQTKDKFSTRTCDTLRIYFQISYYTLLLPVKIEFSSEENKFVCTGNKFHKVICIFLFWIPCCLNYLVGLIHRVNRFFQKPNRLAKEYFTLLTRTVFLIRSVWFFLLFTTSAQQIAKIINTTRTNEPKKPSKKWRWGFGTIYIAFVIVLITFVEVSTVFRYTYERIRYGEVPWLTSYIKGRNKALFLPTDNIPTENFTWWDIITGFYYFWMGASAYVYYALTEPLFYGPLSITLWYAVRDFVEMVKTMDDRIGNEDERKNFQQYVEDEYNNLRELSDGINKLAANIQLLTLTTHCSRAIIELEGAFSSDSPFYLADLLLGILFMAVSLMFSADTFKKMTVFRVWLENGETQQRFFQDKERFKVFLDQVKSDLVGSGNRGVYKFDYSFIAQVLVVSITLFVIGFET